MTFLSFSVWNLHPPRPPSEQRRPDPPGETLRDNYQQLLGTLKKTCGKIEAVFFVGRKQLFGCKSEVKFDPYKMKV